MDGSNAIFVAMPIIMLLALIVAVAMPVVTDIAAERRSRRANQERPVPPSVAIPSQSGPADPAVTTAAERAEFPADQDGPSRF